MKPRARLAALLRPKLRTPSPAQRVQNPYRRLYPGRVHLRAAHPFQKKKERGSFV